MISSRLIFSVAIFFLFNFSTFSQSYIDSLKDLNMESKHDSIKASVFNQISNQYLTINPDSSLYYARQSLSISERKKLYLLQADANLNLGVAYFQKNQYALSLRHLNYALGLYKISKSIFGEANTIFNLSNVYRNIYKYDQSIVYGLESLSLFESIDETYYVRLLSSHLGNDYLLVEDYKTAEKYLKASVSKDADSLLFMQYYIRMGDLYLNGKSNYQKAISYYNIGLQYAMDLNDLNEISRVNNQLGSVYTKLGEYDTALYFLHEGYSYYDKLKSKTMQKLSYEYLIDYYISTENYKNAFDYSLLLAQLKDSIFTQETNTKLAEFEVIYETLKREDEIIMLEDNRQIMSLRIAFLSAMVILVIFFIFYIRKYYREKIERADKEQNKLKSELELKDQELTNNALNLAKNYELLNRTASKLVKSQEKSAEGGQDDIQRIIRDLKNQVSSDSFNEFEMRFLKVHENFYEKLLADYPLLSPNDLRICALLRLNLTSKDIAKILHMSSASVNVSRSRIRKKINMSQDKNLVTFLMEY